LRDPAHIAVTLGKCTPEKKPVKQKVFSTRKVVEMLQFSTSLSFITKVCTDEN